MKETDKIKCTVGVLTLNSGRTLRRALESVKDFDEIIICDGNSTDNTIDIAREYGAIIIKQYDSDEPNLKIGDFSEARNKCLDVAKNDWFLYVDSDEAISTQLKEEIINVTEKNNADFQVYEIPNRIIYDGRIIEHASSYPGYQTRFFNKKCDGRFVKPVHERLEFDKDITVGRLLGPWYVFLDKEDYQNFWEDMRFYVAKEVKRNRNQKPGQFLYWNIIIRLLKIVKLISKIIYMYLRYGTKKTIPFKFEFQRLAYNIYLMYKQIKGRFYNY